MKLTAALTCVCFLASKPPQPLLLQSDRPPAHPVPTAVGPGNSRTNRAASKSRSTNLKSKAGRETTSKSAQRSRFKPRLRRTDLRRDLDHRTHGNRQSQPRRNPRGHSDHARELSRPSRSLSSVSGSDSAEYPESREASRVGPAPSQPRRDEGRGKNSRTEIEEHSSANYLQPDSGCSGPDRRSAGASTQAEGRT